MVFVLADFHARGIHLASISNRDIVISFSMVHGGNEGNLLLPLAFCAAACYYHEGEIRHVCRNDI